MKYRMLTAEEMTIFDEDFKHFLITNGVSNETWIELNEKNVDGATQLVEIFSDSVLQKVYEKVKYIEHRSPGACMVFRLEKEEVTLISISAKSEGIDLSTPESIHEAFVNHSDGLSIFKTKKNYSKERESEIHTMLDQGCVNSSEEFWMLLEKVVE